MVNDIISVNGISKSFGPISALCDVSLSVQQGSCGIEAGFIWSDLLTNLERVSDHCSNIACCMIEGADHNLHRHEVLQSIRGSGEIFDREYSSYRQKYALTAE